MSMNAMSQRSNVIRLMIPSLLFIAGINVVRAYKACPNFENGTWAIGELRTWENSDGEPSRIMDRVYLDKSPRACCDACSRVDGCSYWSWVQEVKGSLVGTCNLFRSFACKSDPDGLLPLTNNKLARTGSSICSRPESRSPAPLEDKRDAAIAEMKAALNAEIAVREEEASKWKEELDTANSQLKIALEEEDKWEAELERASKNLTEAKAALEKAELEYKYAEANLTNTRATVAQESAFAGKARTEYRSTLREIKAARIAKESADELLVSEMAISIQKKADEKAETPQVQCPSKLLHENKWVVGILKDLKTQDGVSTRLNGTLSDVKPKDCCSACASTTDCEFWSWQTTSKHAVKGTCSFFRGTACDKDLQGGFSFDRNTKLGRVGKSCKATSSQ